MTSASTQRLPRISRILGIEPFIITALWTTAEIRRNDFVPLFSQWKAENDSRLYPLFDFKTFKQVAVSPTHTLHWPTVPVRVELARRTIDGVLDLDPDELFRQSTLV